jgi:spermidine/putrescine transport system permease protein
MAVFILAPMFFILYYAFFGTDGSFSFSYFKDALTISTFRILGYSALVAIETTVLCLLLAYPVAYMLSRMKLSTAALLSTLFVIPMWMNFLLRTYALRELLRPLQMMNTEGAVLLGMVYDFLPFMILPIYTVLQKMDKSYIEAAQDLGANGFVTFTKVVLPLSVPGIVSGVTMVFVPSITTFVLSQLLGGNKSFLFGDLIQKKFMFNPSQEGIGSAMALILLVFVLISMGIMRRFDKDTPSEQGGKLW